MLPVEYAEWADRNLDPDPAPSVPPVSSRRKPDAGFHIVSPREGDVYRWSPGVESRYATVALRAAGGQAGTTVRWTVDGAPHSSGRWTLHPGRHRFRAISAAGESAEVTVRVE
jgi:membrane carboxypeptidase/penicillin-binding protein PbpC